MENAILLNGRVSDTDYQCMKPCLRSLGYLPTTKIIYEMAEKTESELTALRFGQIDELCFDDRLMRDDMRRARQNAVRKFEAEYLAKSRYYVK